MSAEIFVPQKQIVFIVEDDASVSEALCDLIESAGLTAACYPSAEAFLAICKPEMAGCLMLDVRLPSMSGVELQGKLAEGRSSLPLIIMTAHGDIPMVRKVLKAGAVESLTKPFQDHELLQAIEHAYAIDRVARSNCDQVRSILLRFDTLTPRERQVMQMVTSGLTNVQVAAQLNLSVVTVKLRLPALRTHGTRVCGRRSLVVTLHCKLRETPWTYAVCCFGCCRTSMRHFSVFTVRHQFNHAD